MQSQPILVSNTEQPWGSFVLPTPGKTSRYQAVATEEKTI
jgi:hypothetical protein